MKLLIERRLLRTVEHERKRLSLTDVLEQATKAWHGVKLFQPDWGDNSHSLALGAELLYDRLSFHLILNAYWEPLDFELPQLEEGRRWKRWVDTALDTPDDIIPWRLAPEVPDNSYRTGARSVAMFFKEHDPPAPAG